jgi:hypothetical protein
VIDTISNQLLVVTTSTQPTTSVELAVKLNLFRCNLDGTECTYRDISAGQDVCLEGNLQFTVGPRAMIDSTSRKLLVVAPTKAWVPEWNKTLCEGGRGDPSKSWTRLCSSKLALFRCNLDGTGCTYTDISAGRAYSPLSMTCQASKPGLCSFATWFPAAVIDATKGKLFVVTQNSWPPHVPYLARPWRAPSEGPDPNPHTDREIGLFRCTVDGTGCVLFNILSEHHRLLGTSDLNEAQLDHRGSAVIDTVDEKLLLVSLEGGLFSVCLH